MKKLNGFFDVHHYRESKDIIVLPWKNWYRSEVLLCFKNRIASIVTALQVCNPSGEGLETKPGLQMIPTRCFTDLESASASNGEREKGKDKFLS